MTASISANAADLTVSALPAPATFGVAVSGLAAAHLDDPEIRRKLYDLWIEHGLIIFRGLYGRDLLVKLSSVFGQLEHSLLKEVAAEDDPYVTSIRYQPETGWLMDLNGERVGSWQPWHTDGIYGRYPNRGGILTPIVMTSRDGETGFIDKIAAYDSLPDDIKHQIEGLSVIYRLDPINGFERPRFGQQSVKTIRYNQSVLAVNKRLDDYPPMAHPLIHIERETGRKVLNLSPLFADAIEGLPQDESDALLRTLIAHATAQSLAYYHSYEPGDMVLWDNWRILHCAAGSPPEEERVMERTTIAGEHELHQA